MNYIMNFLYFQLLIQLILNKLEYILDIFPELFICKALNLRFN
jgi:hypothetical protein